MKNKKNLIKGILILSVFFIICLIYAHYEYTQLQVKKIVLESKDIHEEFNGKKILFLADFQLDTWGRYNKRQMDRIIERENLMQERL